MFVCAFSFSGCCSQGNKTTGTNNSLLSAGADSSVKLWDVANTTEQTTGERVVSMVAEIPRKTGHQFGVSAIQWWPFDNGMFVTSSFDGRVNVWDPNAMDQVYSFDMKTKLYSFDIAAGPHGSPLVATAADHPLLRLLDLRTTSSAHTLSGHSGRVHSVRWCPTNANLLASGGSDGTVRLWDIRRSRACVASLDMQHASDGTPAIPMTMRRAHRAAVNGLWWLPTGDYLFSAGNDEKIRLWSLYEPHGRNMLVNFGPLVRNRHIQTVQPCLTAPGDLPSPYLLYPSDNGEIYMYSAMDGKLVRRLHRQGGAAVARTACIIPRGARSLEYFSGAFDGTITSWSPGIPETDDRHETLGDYWGDLGELIA